MRRVVLGRAPTDEAQPALHAERIRYGADEDAAGTEHAADLRAERVRKPEVLEELSGDDGIEARILERERFLDVRLHGLDPQGGRLLERRAVDVEPDDRVPLEEVPRQRSGPATEVEYPLAASDGRAKERDSLGDED